MTLSGALVLFALGAVLALIVSLVRMVQLLDALGCTWIFTGKHDDE